MSAVEHAPAKINLYLHVGEPAPHGRHPLESAVVFASAGDIVEAHEDEGLTLSVHGAYGGDLAAEPDNLVLRAARELALEAGIGRPGAALTLEKRLPVASGMGGGSADAAAALRALNRLWRLKASKDDLARVARRIGADVPVCVASAAAFMSGTGEDTHEMTAPDFDAVLVNPDFSLPTAAVFQTFDMMGLGAGFSRTQRPHWRSRDEALAALGETDNDLTLPARKLAPVIGEALDLLAGDARVLLARMTGSGATVFALTNDASSAAALAGAVRARHPDWWAAETRLNAIDPVTRRA
ncbi:MAG: 4-(cytidine 5'-diphospho)-2-C-methyl-D-erythritol kinase [Hyphomonadaceae bacterium]